MYLKIWENLPNMVFNQLRKELLKTHKNAKRNKNTSENPPIFKMKGLYLIPFEYLRMT